MSEIGLLYGKNENAFKFAEKKCGTDSEAPMLLLFDINVKNSSKLLFADSASRCLWND